MLFETISIGYYEVWVNGVKISQHTKESKANDKAKEECLKLLIKNPDKKPNVIVKAPALKQKINMDLLNTFLSYKKSNTIEDYSPILKNFRIKDEYKDRIYFDSNSKIIASTIVGFTINNVTISSVSINANETQDHYFTVANAFTYWDNPIIRYEGGSDLKLTSNNEPLLEFSLTYIENQISEPTATNNVFYVSKSGNDNNNGTSISSPFLTLEKAVRSFSSGGGNTVHVKAGKYDGESMRRQESSILSGTSTNPNKIIGYKNIPGDLDGVSIYNYTPGNANTPPSLDEIEYPVFDGLDRGENDNSLIHTKGADGYIIKNIALTGYKRGFDSWSNAQYWSFDNIIGLNNGSTTTNSGALFYFNAAGCNNHRYKNIVSVNATGDHILVDGDNNAIINCKVYSNEATSSGDIITTTDYYYHMRGSNNLIYGSLAYKNTPNGWGHNGHGFTLKAANVITEYNLIENCEAVNIFGAYEFRHPEVRFNVVKNSISRADIPNRTASGSKQGSGGISFLMGAKNNVAENCKIIEVDAAIVYGDNSEETTDPGAENNVVKNCTFKNVDSYFLTFNANSIGTTHQNNTIEHCTFYNANRVYNNLSTNPITFTGCKLKNCILFDIPNGSTPNGWQFTYNNYWEHWLSNGTPSANTGNISVNPNFVNTEDFVPQNTLLNAGLTGDVKVDINNKKRKAKPTIGAFEIGA